jgi:hypothetical protein
MICANVLSFLARLQNFGPRRRTIKHFRSITSEGLEK